MTDFERKEPAREPERDQGVDFDSLCRPERPLIPRAVPNVGNIFEGELADLLQVELGICDPDILDHLTGIEVDGISTGALAPIHPETRRPIKTIFEAYELGQERDRFQDGYQYAEFQESLGRSTLFHLACINAGTPRLSAFDPKFSPEKMLDLNALGGASYGRAALEGFDLRDDRTGVWKAIYENFEICRYALSQFHKRFVFGHSS